MGCFQRRRERDGRKKGKEELVSICLRPLEGRQGPKPGSRGLCRFNDLFPRDQILHLNYH